MKTALILIKRQRANQGTLEELNRLVSECQGDFRPFEFDEESDHILANGEKVLRIEYSDLSRLDSKSVLKRHCHVLVDELNKLANLRETFKLTYLSIVEIY